MAKTTIPPELIKLREVYGSSTAAKAILDDFSHRTNNQRITTIDQILSRLRFANVERWEAIALFRKLEELEHGRFVEGRKGRLSRFVWSSNPIEVGRAAQGDDASINLVSLNASADERREEMRTYVFPLRSNTDANFELPSDLTLKEAERLSAFLKSLAVPD
jgi:hypothetical protein